MSLLQDDLKIKFDDKRPLARKPIGFVIRGGFSQARGHGMAFGMVSSTYLTALAEVNQTMKDTVAKG